MCTAVTYQTKDFYFGRTLDYEHSFAEEVTITPRQFPFAFRHHSVNADHYAIIGMACMMENYPLYFDAVNEKGLGMAGLNFVGNAHYNPPIAGRDNVTSFEFIPWILSQCASVAEAKRLLERINITNETFAENLPASQLHWIIADKYEAITVESTADGLRIYENPVGVLTNNPPFPYHMLHLCDYMALSNEPPAAHLGGSYLAPYSRGMGAMGLPGDLSSASRFVRAAFVKENAVSAPDEMASVGQFFHMLGAVEHVRGCVRLADGKYEITAYTSCINLFRGIYYYTTYNNRAISAVSLVGCALEGGVLCRFPLEDEQRIFWHR